jgi:hypothetical protein
MDCPIGLKQVVGKMPMEVAISVAGQIIESYQALLPNEELLGVIRQSKSTGVAWKEIKQLLSVTNDEQTPEQMIAGDLTTPLKNKAEELTVMDEQYMIESKAVK